MKFGGHGPLLRAPTSMTHITFKAYAHAITHTVATEPIATQCSYKQRKQQYCAINGSPHLLINGYSIITTS